MLRLLIALVALLSAACAGPAATPLQTVMPTAGATAAPATAAPTAAGAAATVSVSPAGYFVGPDGKTLYTFDQDSPGTSACSGGCLQTWPALTVTGMDAITIGSGLNAGDFATITRADDGALQVTFKQIPLYFFAGDSAPGDTNGDGMNGVWHVATTASTLPSPAPAASASPAAPTPYEEPDYRY